MSPSQALARRSPASLETVHDILGLSDEFYYGTLVPRYIYAYSTDATQPAGPQMVWKC